MQELLFLSHRIPYPPRKGDKIRSWHWLRHLASRYRVHLGTFIDDPADEPYLGAVREICASVCAVRLRPKLARLASARALWTGEALTLPYFRSRRLTRWVGETLSTRPVRVAFAYSSSMAQYLIDRPQVPEVRLFDFVDVDSAKWRQYGQEARGAAGWLYRREGRRLELFERHAANHADLTLFVSDEEAALFLRGVPYLEQSVRALENGVDTHYFTPDADMPSPFAADVRPLVFTGAMDYRANVDAVVWFGTQVFPSIRARHPEAEFWIVGAHPTAAVRGLEHHSGVHVTGAVPDVRPYLRHAAMAVAPLRVARGIQNKVLEAMAMGCCVVATPQAMEGLKEREAFQSLVAESPEALADAVTRVMRGEADGLGAEGRRHVLKHYGWADRERRLDELMAGVGA